MPSKAERKARNSYLVIGGIKYKPYLEQTGIALLSMVDGVEAPEEEDKQPLLVIRLNKNRSIRLMDEKTFKFMNTRNGGPPSCKECGKVIIVKTTYILTKHYKYCLFCALKMKLV